MSIYAGGQQRVWGTKEQEAVAIARHILSIKERISIESAQIILSVKHIQHGLIMMARTITITSTRNAPITLSPIFGDKKFTDNRPIADY